MPVRRQGLAQGEEVLRPVVPHERFGDGLPGGLDAAVAVRASTCGSRSPARIASRMARPVTPGDVAEDVVELEVHLVEGLLHVLGVGGRQTESRVSRWRRRDRTAQTVSGGRKEARRRPDGVEVLEPLAVLDVGLPAGDVLHVARVDQADLEPAGLQDLVQGDPVDAGGLHGHGGDAALREPIREGVEVLREGPEAPDGLRVAVERHADVDLGGADVDARRRAGCRIGIVTGRVDAAAASGHGVSSSVRG